MRIDREKLNQLRRERGELVEDSQPERDALREIERLRASGRPDWAIANQIGALFQLANARVQELMRSGEGCTFPQRKGGTTR